MKTVSQLLKEAAVKDSKISLPGITYGGKYKISGEPGFEEGDYHVKWPGTHGTKPAPRTIKTTSPGKQAHERSVQTHGRELAGREAFASEVARKQFGLNVLNKQAKKTYFHPFKGYQKSGVYALASKWNPSIKGLPLHDDYGAAHQDAFLHSMTKEQRQHAARTFIYQHVAGDSDILKNSGNYQQDINLPAHNNHTITDTGMSFVWGIYNPAKSQRIHTKNPSSGKSESKRERFGFYQTKEAIDRHFNDLRKENKPILSSSIEKTSKGEHRILTPDIQGTPIIGHILKHHPEDFDAAIDHVKSHFNAADVHQTAIKHGIKDPWLGYKVQKQFEHVMGHLENERAVGYKHMKRDVPSGHSLSSGTEVENAVTAAKAVHAQRVMDARKSPSILNSIKKSFGGKPTDIKMHPSLIHHVAKAVSNIDNNGRVENRHTQIARRELDIDD